MYVFIQNQAPYNYLLITILIVSSSMCMCVLFQCCNLLKLYSSFLFQGNSRAEYRLGNSSIRNLYVTDSRVTNICNKSHSIFSTLPQPQLLQWIRQGYTQSINHSYGVIPIRGSCNASINTKIFLNASLILTYCF